MHSNEGNGKELKKTKLAAFCSVGAVLLFLPWIFRTNIFIVHLFCLLGLNVVISMGFIIILGFSRQFSLAQVAFYGIGAYTTAVLTKDYGLNFFLALPMAALTAGLFSIIVAVPGTRFKGPWLALITFAFAEIARILFSRLKELTGGNAGFYGIPKPAVGGFVFDTTSKYYYIFLIVAVIVVFITTRLRYSPQGRIWISIGDNDIISSSVGVNVFSQKIWAFFLGSCFAGLAGGLYAGYANFISPLLFTLKHTLFYLTILVLGGLGSIVGVVATTIVFTIASNYLRGLYPWDLVLYGLLIMLTVNLLPEGIGKALTDLWERVKARFLVKAPGSVYRDQYAETSGIGGGSDATIGE